FTIAFEDRKPQGVLVGTGGTADFIKEVIGRMHRGLGKIVYESEPKKLVAEVIKMIKQDKKLKEHLRRKTGLV
ncbi:MAG: hypothetical protein AAB581_02055, partial [Patescibacteria group bacterium]